MSKSEIFTLNGPCLNHKLLLPAMTKQSKPRSGSPIRSSLVQICISLALTRYLMSISEMFTLDYSSENFNLLLPNMTRQYRPRSDPLLKSSLVQICISLALS